MKPQAAQEVKALLKGARHDIIKAAHLANGGQPAGKDIAQLMEAWGQIAKTIAHPRAAANKSFVDAQLSMLNGLIGDAA